MKKIFLLISVIFSLCLFSFSVSAENSVSRIDVDIVINNDGSADIHQVWQCDFHEDTEVYYFFPHEDNFNITDFTVKDEDKTYTTVSNWDISLSFEEKAGKCGVLEDSEGYELCWGITEYGSKTYHLNYKVLNFVTSYEDADAGYFSLFSKNIETTPTDITVKLSLADGKELYDGCIFDRDTGFVENGNCAYMNEGFTGYAEIRDGMFYAGTEWPLTYDDYMAFSFVFEKGLLSPVTAYNTGVDRSENDFINKYNHFGQMFYDEPDNIYESELFILGTAFAIAFGVPMLILALAFLFYKLYIKSAAGKPEINRNEPSLGIEASYIILKDFGFCKEKNLLALIVLDMINKGAVTPIMPDAGDPIPVKNGNVKFRINTIDPADLNESQQRFYKFLSFAAKDDNILEPVELVLKSQDCLYTLTMITEQYAAIGNSKIDSSNCKNSTKRKGPFAYSVNGKEELRKILGYKKYINEYSLHNSVNYFEYDVWQTPMRYSILFGGSDKVRDELLKIYPSRDYDIRDYGKNILFAEQSAKLIYNAMKATEKSLNSGRGRGYYSSHSSYRGGGFRGGGGFGGGRSGGGTR